MRRTVLTAAVIAAIAAAGGTAAAASPRPGPASSGSTTLVFQVVFSPFEFIQANNVRNPQAPIALGDEIVAHDQLFSQGRHVGDDAVSFVIVSAPPNAVLANGAGIFRIPGGTIAFQTHRRSRPGPQTTSGDRRHLRLSQRRR